MRHRLLGAALVPALALVSVLVPALAHAQRLGPFRQFLAVEPYYVHTEFDRGASDGARTSTDGYGLRVWVNAAPFSANRARTLNAVSLFANISPTRGTVGTLHYGASIDQFFVHRPIGGFLDPLVSLGVGGYQTRRDVYVRNAAGERVFAATDKRTRLAITPGVGLRIPVPNRLELRADARRAYLVNAQPSSRGQRTQSHNEFTAGVGVTF